jgi:hypothetical protein
MACSEEAYATILQTAIFRNTGLSNKPFHQQELRLRKHCDTISLRRRLGLKDRAAIYRLRRSSLARENLGFADGRAQDNTEGPTAILRERGGSSIEGTEIAARFLKDGYLQDNDISQEPRMYCRRDCNRTEMNMMERTLCWSVPNSAVRGEIRTEAQLVELRLVVQCFMIGRHVNTPKN